MRGMIMAALLASSMPVAAQDAGTAVKVIALAKLQSANSPTLSPDGGDPHHRIWRPEDPGGDAESLSPLNKIDRVKTPLFMLYGANDTNVPVVGAEQIVASLKARGAPVKYTLFPDEGRGWRKTPNRVRSTTEIVGFFVEDLKPGVTVAAK